MLLTSNMLTKFIYEEIYKKRRVTKPVNGRTEINNTYLAPAHQTTTTAATAHSKKL